MSPQRIGTADGREASNSSVDLNLSDDRAPARRVSEFEQRLFDVHPRMRRLAVRLVGSEADDVLQESYISAFRAQSQFRGEARFETWLYRIVYNTCISHLRKYRPSMVSDLELEFASGRADTARSAATRVDLVAALGSLGPSHRAAVLLVDAEGLSYEETAAVLGLPRGTVASRVSRARKILRSQLTEKP